MLTYRRIKYFCTFVEGKMRLLAQGSPSKSLVVRIHVVFSIKIYPTPNLTCHNKHPCFSILVDFFCYPSGCPFRWCKWWNSPADVLPSLCGAQGFEVFMGHLSIDIHSCHSYVGKKMNKKPRGSV